MFSLLKRVFPVVLISMGLIAMLLAVLLPRFVAIGPYTRAATGLMDGSASDALRFENICKPFISAVLIPQAADHLRIVRFAGDKVDVIHDALLQPQDRIALVSMILALKPFTLAEAMGSPISRRAREEGHLLQERGGGLLFLGSDAQESPVANLSEQAPIEPGSLNKVTVIAFVPADSQVVTALKTAGATVHVVASIAEAKTIFADLRGDSAAKRILRSSAPILVVAGILCVLTGIGLLGRRLVLARQAARERAEALCLLAEDHLPEDAGEVTDQDFDIAEYLPTAPTPADLVTVTVDHENPAILPQPFTKALLPGDPASSVIIAGAPSPKADMTLIKPLLVGVTEPLLFRVQLGPDRKFCVANHGRSRIIVLANGIKHKLAPGERMRGGQRAIQVQVAEETLLYISRDETRGY